MKTISTDTYTNNLINETSPYLLQHAHNPVLWHPWGEVALQKAKDENKMLLISIGYSACHWCHVMEHESFEDEEVARIMNENFVCIKVDREERPDVDQVYMNAVQLLSGSGGWPLNCFALPDGSPVYGGTYYPKQQWIQVLNHLADIYKSEPEKVIQQAEALKQGIQQAELIQVKAEQAEYSQTDLDEFYQGFMQNSDAENGGFGAAPKFPMPGNWLFLLRYHYITGNQLALDHTLLSLDKIAAGGIYDHVGGGFARYATRANWNVPHFEKMLYDNGQLLSVYSEVYQLTRNEKYRQVVYETVDFISRELSSDEGAFFSALDADSEDEEGKYYVWTRQELDAALGENAKLFCDYFNVTAAGNWEKGKNNLFISESLDEVAAKHHLTVEEAQKQLKESKAGLLNKRAGRIRPGLDNKILTSWNAMVVKGLSDAYRVFGDPQFIQKASAAAQFILAIQTGKDYSLKRNYKEGKSTIPALLDDYALTIDAFINLYKATFNEAWLKHADGYTRYALKHFQDTNSTMFYYTDEGHNELVVRKMELSDNVIPASNSVMANNLYKLGKYLGKSHYNEMASQMLANVIDEVKQYGRYYSNWGILLLNHIAEPPELAITGPQTNNIKFELGQHYLPELILAGSNSSSALPLLKNRLVDGKTLLYVCKNNTCKLPAESVKEAVKLILPIR